MNRFTFAIAVLIISVYQFGYTTTIDNNKTLEYLLLGQQQKIEAPLESTFNELVNPMNNNKSMDNLLTRRKGKIKYSELKVNWKKLVKYLDEKKRNPDTIMLKNKKKLA